jgi:hypothetical protein
MKQPSKMPPLKYAPKAWTTLLFFVLLAGAFCLFQGRKEGPFRLHFPGGPFADYHQHISNFSLTYLLYSGIGYIWLLAGVQQRQVSLLGAAFLLANLVYELWLPLLNTRDLVDAYYGFGGALAGALFLWVVKAYGLRLPTNQQ